MIVTVDALDRLKGIRHGFLTRRGGVSDGIYDSLNCGLGTTDERARVFENRARAMKAAGLLDGPLNTAYQVHSAKVLVVETPLDQSNRPEVDGLVTRTKGINLGVLTADCGPVLFADAEAGVIGAAHAGWKGALSGVLQETVRVMEILGARRENIVAAIGPCIGQDSYEVGTEFPTPFIEQDRDNARFFAANACRKFQFDLAGYCAAQLQSLGLAEVVVSGHDTCALEDDFFSYRRKTKRDEPDYGRQVSVIGIV
ncbi:peptidoglycan editing factor PgeF [Dongia sp.]|uniref:peptidoglycan editing factor PgeF n=1 Tax=Dongia sp. TaxID=1977262 RepID=UPI0035AE58DA